MINTLNKIIINTMMLLFLGAIAYIYFDLGSTSNVHLLENERPRYTHVQHEEQAVEVVEQTSPVITAGDVFQLTGEVNATDVAGSTKTLRNGDSITVGDIISTAKDARAQIRFTDNSQITLYGGSSFTVVDYHFDDDKSGKKITHLLKGQLRALSGLIGKRSGDVYQMRTHVATIGIRGTEYALRFCYAQDCVVDNKIIKAGLYVGVIDGAVVVDSQADTTIVKKGEVVHKFRTDIPTQAMSYVDNLFIDGESIAKKDNKNDLRKWILEKVN